MTDAELVELLAQKTPEELTPEEIDLLKSRLDQSSELRQVLVDQLHMETYLAAALGRVSISPEQVIARARQQTQAGSGGVLILLAALICLPLLALAGAVLMNAVQDRTGDEPVAVVAKQSDKASATAKAIPPAKSSVEETPRPQPDIAPPAAPPIAAPPPMPAVDPPPPAPAVLPPWQAALEVGEPPPFTEIAFQPFDTSKSMPQHDDLRQWFEATPGFNFQVHRVDTRRGPCAAIEGLARLRAPWPEQSVLRLALENYNRLKLHFFHGEQGVTLVYYEDQNFRWAAYATTREPGQPQPKTWAITGTDDERCRRTELRQGGPIELRYRAGEVILSRGDIVLTSAPLAGPPTDVFFEGRTSFEGIAMVRATGDPTPLAPLPVVLDLTRPAELDWKSTKPEIAQAEKMTDGAVRLAADNAKEPVTVYAALPREGLHEVALELDDVTAGTGVLLCNKAGQNHFVVRFYRDRRSDSLRAVLRNADGSFERDFETPHDKPAAAMGSKCWVKLLYGCGSLRWWLSSDGVHWAEPEMAVEGAPPELTHIGLQLVPNRPATHLTLRRIVVRELAGLASLAPAELRERAIGLAAVPSLGAWLAEVLPKKPADVATSDWLRACALRSLAAGMHRDQACPLLEALLDDMAARDLPLPQQLAALGDALLMNWDLRDGGAMRRGVPRRLIDLGLAQAQQHGLPAWSSVRQTVMSGPMFTHLIGPLELERSIRHETIQRAYAAQPDETLDFLRMLRLYDQQRYSFLDDWAESLAARDRPGKATGEGLSKLKDGWRDPLIEELSKETYNATTEIQAVLESEAWPEAARLIAAVDIEAAPGVAPYIRDRMLLASLSVAVRLTLDDYPPVREALSEQFGPLAQLRVGQAMAAGDASTVEMATVQFAGTEAAGQAHQWLGDRALSSGWFERAIAEYRRAASVLPALQGQIEPRIRLSAAMLGRDEGQPAMQPVIFGEVSMSPAEFEALVAEMRGRAGGASLAAAGSPLQPGVPLPRRYEAHVRSRLDGPVGDRPQEEVGERRTNQFRVPWADRQIATAVEGDVLYVTNRFQVAAYNLTNGQRMWQSESPPGPIQRSQEWAMIPMRPLITSTRIYVRLLYSPNPLLVCLEKSSGKLLWSTGAAPREFFASDPVIAQGQLGAISIALQLEQQGMLRWNLIDPETGELQSQRDLVRLRNTWGKRTCCQVAELGDSVVAVLGGVTLALDPAGQLLWVRKQITVPAEEDPRWVLQMYDRPLVAGDKIFVTQPGVRTVDCLDPRTGRLHWSAVLPEVVGLVGLSGDRLIVRTEKGLRALEAATGSPLWRREAAELHSFQLAGDSALLLAERELSATAKDHWLTRLVWLDAASGQATATCLLPSLADADPRLGPLVPYKDRIFTLLGRGQHDPNRDVVELVPVGEAERTIPDSARSNPWLQRTPQSLIAAGFAVLPDWQLLSAADGDRTGPVPEIHGEKDVLAVRCTGATPIVLGREIALPGMGRPRLRLRVGSDPGQIWKLEVRHGEQVLKTEEIKDETHKDRWKSIEVDLSPAAGKTGWLTIRLQSTNGDHVLWLKGAEVVF